MKTYKFFWTLLATASLIMSCQKESNPLAQREQNISDLVYQAENESDQTTPNYNSNLQKIEVAHFGLSYDYLITTKIPALCGYYDYNDINFEYFYCHLQLCQGLLKSNKTDKWHFLILNQVIE
jgi:hypothetical protein